MTAELPAPARRVLALVGGGRRRGLRGPSERWRRRAACVGRGPDLFFPVGELTEAAVQQTAAAKAVCATCEVRLHCLAWALAAGADSGVWGGLSAGERQRLRRERTRRRQAGAAQSLDCNSSMS